MIDEISQVPQTYETILKGEKGNGTLQFMLRKKLNRAYKEGEICKTEIPCTRCGKIIYYSFNRSYHIFFVGTRFGADTYYCYDYITSGVVIQAGKGWKLKGDTWEEVSPFKISKGHLLKCI